MVWDGINYRVLVSPPLKRLFKGPPPSLLGIPLRGWEGFLQWTISPTITCVQASTHRPERPFYWKRNRNAKEITKSCCHRPNRDLVFRKIKEESCSANSVYHSLSQVTDNWIAKLLLNPIIGKTHFYIRKIRLSWWNYWILLTTHDWTKHCLSKTNKMPS